MDPLYAELPTLRFLLEKACNRSMVEGSQLLKDMLTSIHLHDGRPDRVKEAMSRRLLDDYFANWERKMEYTKGR